jgi:hypothetical protein
VAEEYPWRRPPKPPPGAKNCGSCINFPCAASLAQGDGQLMSLSGVATGSFPLRPEARPMACGGVDWVQKPEPPERPVREREGAAFEQFKKK